MSTVKIATTVLSNSVAIGAENNPISTIIRPDHKCCYSIADLVEGRTYNFTTTMPLNNPAVLVTKKVGGQEIITRRYDGNDENQPFSVTIRVGENRIYVNNSENSEVVISYNNEADFDPKPANFSAPQPFRFWCQTVLPLVYDDSLSYYELLAKVVKYLNALIKDVSNVENIYTNLTNAYAELEAYVNTYFDNLDVSEAINNKLDYMADHGDFDVLVAEALQRVNYTAIINAEVDSQLPDVVETKIGGVVADQIGATVADQINAVVASQIGDVVGEQIDASVAGQIGASVAEQITPIVGEQVAEQIGTAVSNWLARNFTNPPVDKSLTIDNAAADAKVVGKALNYMSDMSIEGYSRKEENLDGELTRYNPNYFVKSGNSIILVEASEERFNSACITNLIGGARYKITLNDDTSEISGWENFKAGWLCNNVIIPTQVGRVTATIITALEDIIGVYPNGDYYFNMPYNCDAIIFNSLNSTLCSLSLVTNEYETNGVEVDFPEINIEGFNNKLIPRNVEFGKKMDASGEIVSDADYNTARINLPIIENGQHQTIHILATGTPNDVALFKYVNNTYVAIGYYNDEGEYEADYSFNYSERRIQVNTKGNPYTCVSQFNNNSFVNEGIKYVTSAPNFNNTSGYLRLAVLDSLPATLKKGWIYAIIDANKEVTSLVINTH